MFPYSVYSVSIQSRTTNRCGLFAESSTKPARVTVHRHGHGARLAPFAPHTGHGHKTGPMAPHWLSAGDNPPSLCATTGHRYQPRPRLDNPQLCGHYGANHPPATIDRATLRPACPVQVLNVQNRKALGNLHGVHHASPLGLFAFYGLAGTVNALWRIVQRG